MFTKILQPSATIDGCCSKYSKGCGDEMRILGTHMDTPSLLVIVDDGSPQAASGVNAGSRQGDGGQMNHEHGEPNGQRRQHLLESPK